MLPENSSDPSAMYFPAFAKSPLPATGLSLEKSPDDALDKAERARIAVAWKSWYDTAVFQLASAPGFALRRALRACAPNAPAATPLAPSAEASFRRTSLSLELMIICFNVHPQRPGVCCGAVHTCIRMSA